MDQKFGKAPAKAVSRVKAADGATLEHWLGRVLEAGSIAEVFEE